MATSTNSNAEDRTKPNRDENRANSGRVLLSRGLPAPPAVQQIEQSQDAETRSHRKWKHTRTDARISRRDMDQQRAIEQQDSGEDQRSAEKDLSRCSAPAGHE
jgi:hypothetical protein